MKPSRSPQPTSDLPVGFVYSPDARKRLTLRAENAGNLLRLKVGRDRKFRQRLVALLLKAQSSRARAGMRVPARQGKSQSKVAKDLIARLGTDSL